MNRNYPHLIFTETYAFSGVIEKITDVIDRRRGTFQAAFNHEPKLRNAI